MMDPQRKLGQRAEFQKAGASEHAPGRYTMGESDFTGSRLH